MNKRLLNILVILVTGIAIVILNEFEYLENPSLKKYIFIPLLGYFLMGQWSSRIIK
ncbi:MAG: hypothetical protein ACJAWO_001962 [Halieaceae bacterium]|jgi:hypothetical protein